MQDDGPAVKGDPFYESQENHNLIGVANVFLECLFHDVKLDYHVPIISQQGEVIMFENLSGTSLRCFLLKFVNFMYAASFRQRDSIAV